MKRKPRINIFNEGNYSEDIRVEMRLEMINIYFKHRVGKATQKDLRRFKAITKDSYINPQFYYETMLQETPADMQRLRLSLQSKLETLRK